MGQFWSRLRGALGLRPGEERQQFEASSDEPQPEACAAPERREWPRVKLEVSARIRFPTTEAAIESRTFDISRGGVFLRMPEPRPCGTGVRLVVEVGERTMVLAGVVARVSDGYNGLPGMGVRFTEIGADDEEFLADLVDARQAREPAFAVQRSSSRH